MVEVYLIKIPGETENAEAQTPVNVELLPCSVKERILNTKDSGTKNERAYAYTLMRAVLNKRGVSDAELRKSFLFDEKGKPFLKDSDFEISVTHTDGMAAVAVSEGGPVGIDLEKIDFLKRQRLEKIIARFYKESDSVALEKNITKKNLVCLGENRAYVNEIKSEAFTDEDAPFVKWTVLEAALKHVGTGFECVKDAEKIMKELRIEASVISFDGNRYALSVAFAK